MKTITLLTDFGTKDGYPGVMKGVILNILPDVQLIDLTHTISPQNVFSGSLVLEHSFPFFPVGTVHIAVVDPGVGTHRRPIAARLGQHFFILPDNGLITMPLQYAQKQGWDAEFVHLDQPRYWLPDVSNVFHGRDIFAPSAAHLAAGVPLYELGTPISDPVLLDIPLAQRTTDGWLGQVLEADHFGNLSTNITANDLDSKHVLSVRCGGEEIQSLSRTFGERPAGELVALIDSDGRLSVCVVNGSALSRLGVQPGAPVEVILQS